MTSIDDFRGMEEDRERGDALAYEDWYDEHGGEPDADNDEEEDEHR